MANVSISTNCSISFTNEENEILQKASDICKRIGHEIWQTGSGTDAEDEVSFFFTGIGGSIENALKGNYWMP